MREPLASNKFHLPGGRAGRELFFALTLSALVACGGGGGGGGAGNTAPVANAGSDQIVQIGSVVTLDGSGSRDTDGDALTYTWSLTTPAGSNATLSSSTVVRPSFSADAEGVYTATLIVNDGILDSVPDSATITAGPPGVLVGGRVTFDRVPHLPNGGLDYNNIFPAPARGVLVEAIATGGAGAGYDGDRRRWQLQPVPAQQHAGDGPGQGADETGRRAVLGFPGAKQHQRRCAVYAGQLGVRHRDNARHAGSERRFRLGCRLRRPTATSGPRHRSRSWIRSTRRCNSCWMRRPRSRCHR